MPLLKRSKKKTALKKSNQNLSELSMFDRAAKNIYSVLDSNYNDRLVLGAKDQKFRNILNRELEISKGYSQGSVVDFINSLKLDQQKRRNLQQPKLNPNSNELFTKNINDIFGYFQDQYKNRYIEIDDLKFIAKFIPALGEAVKTVLDSVVSSDNIAETLNREIQLPNGISPEDKTAIINEIERIEKELKLKKRLKTNVYKKTLISGTHYVYAVSYNRIFEEYDAIQKRKNQDLQQMGNTQFGSSKSSPNTSANEGFVLGDVDISPAMEGIYDLLSSSVPLDPTKKKMDKKSIESTVEDFKDSLPTFTCDTSSFICSEALESAGLLIETPGALEAYKKGRKKKKKSTGEFQINPLEVRIPDGTIGEDKLNTKPSKFDISGTYVKYIDAKNLIPIRAFDQTIGYYLIHTTDKNSKISSRDTSGITSISNILFNSVNVAETKKQDAIQHVIDTISEGILANFNNKFVKNNAEFKKLIGDVIIANGLTDKDYNIQFIPAEDIIPFTIQEDENGFGESILSDSLFPAKLLLSMIVTRMLNYINKTGNKTIAHIHRGPVNAFDNNQLNRVIRDLQDQDITFNDLLSPNLVFNKFNRDGNMAIPTSVSGDHLIDFEIQEGQQIDMTPDYEKQLEEMSILGTGVPTVIMEYAGSADFAKQLVSANIKYAGRIASLQADLEEPTTIFYKKLCQNSNLTDAQKSICAQSLEIKLPRPRVLTNSNNGEYVQTMVSTAEALADVILGRDTLTDEEKRPGGQRIKEKLMLKIVKSDTPFLAWDELETMAEETIIEVEEEIVRKMSDTQTTDTSSDTDMF